jgi:hypothetical protein
MTTKKRTSNVPVFKQAQEELKQATFLVLSPDEVDLHGDIYDAVEVRKACHNFNIHCRKANLLHLFDTNAFSIVESYTSPVEMKMGETIIKAGSWLAVLQFNDDSIWEGVKNGDYTGVSISGKADAELLYEDNDD